MFELMQNLDINDVKKGVYSASAIQAQLDAGTIFVSQTVKENVAGLHLPFTARQAKWTNNACEYSQVTLVLVYHFDTLIGGFVRNYSAFGVQTFSVFKQKEQWYALYSPDYTGLRVLKLHSDHIEDWCGQPETSYGFCPVETTVPYGFEAREPAYGYTKIFWMHSPSAREDACQHDEIRHYLQNTPPTPDQIVFADIALYSGCYWGDDSNWKLRIADLREVEHKRLILKEPFGYVEQPLLIESLADLIDMTTKTSFDVTMTKSMDLDELDDIPEQIETLD